MLIRLIAHLIYWLFRWGVTSTETPTVTHYNAAPMNVVCPSCGNAMYEGVVLCNRCGRNRHTGQFGA